MAEKNLPIKMVLPKSSDTQGNIGGGSIKYFGECNDSVRKNIHTMFSDVLKYYDDFFDKETTVPAVGKITVKPDAIAKSHKPNDLCRCCPIIGGEDLDEIYIKVSKKGIADTLCLIQNPPTEKFKANMTAISSIEPIRQQDKISEDLKVVVSQGLLSEIQGKIKVKIFDFDDDFDNQQVWDYVLRKLQELGLYEKAEIIQYGSHIKYIKVAVSSYEQVEQIADINGVKNIDFFQKYSLPIDTFSNTELETLLSSEYQECDTIIGIIDGGISDKCSYLQPYIVGREVFVAPDYQNHEHGTFIASTIEFGNELNQLSAKNNYRFKLFDVVAIPNGDKNKGKTDTISEDDLMDIIEEVMEKHSDKVKIWNMSLGIPNKLCGKSMSDLGIFLDYIQDKYNVQIIVSAGNLEEIPLRTWPSQKDMKERDRIISPADSVRAITVGSVALYDSADSIVKENEPSPFSRRGPGSNYIVKPDLVDYGGNLSITYDQKNLAMRALSPEGKMIEGNGTSYSTPRITQKCAAVFDEMVDKDLLLAKALLVHSARMNSRDLLNDDLQENINYYGFGNPSINISDILHCSDHEMTLVFKQAIQQGTHLEMFDFPYPKSLITNGKCKGEICMTLVYSPILDQNYGKEYCRTNVDVSFGTYKVKDTGVLSYNGQVPLERAWDEKFEQSRVEHGFKWSPVKSYYRKISSRGIDVKDGWKIRIDMTPRNGLIAPPQEFVLVLTIRDITEQHDVYSDMVNGLNERSYITNNIETRHQIRQRQ